ncbi:MAG TPA: hypothetical protein VFH48_04375 [Chloroflexota bacterium]|nr:hypothetical protein [Chloroflexota bacterium]
MTTDRQLAANRQNAEHTTGPRTAQGKAISSRNNTRHGLRSATPVIPRLESPEAWQQHRAATLERLAPAEPLEEALAERIALILWRLGRIARYERQATVRSQAEAPDDLAAEYDEHQVETIRADFANARRRLSAFTCFRQLRPDAPIAGTDAEFILVAVAHEAHTVDFKTWAVPGLFGADDRLAELPGWTVERVQQAIDALAQADQRDPDHLLQAALDTVRAAHNTARVAYRRVERQVQSLRRERVLPQTPSAAPASHTRPGDDVPSDPHVGHSKPISPLAPPSQPPAPDGTGTSPYHV